MWKDCVERSCSAMVIYTVVVCSQMSASKHGFHLKDYRKPEEHKTIPTKYFHHMGYCQNFQTVKGSHCIITGKVLACALFLLLFCEA